MDPFLAGSAIQTGGGILNDVLGMFTQKKREQRAAQQSKQNIQNTLQANKELAKYQYGQDLQMWQRANEYNAPTAQMQRLKAAGLNPNMVYGSGGATTQAATLPKYQNVTADYSSEKAAMPVMPQLSAFTDTAMKIAQLKNLSAQTKLVEEKTATETMNALLRNHQSLNEQAKSALSQGLAQYASDFAAQQLQRNRLTNEKIQADIGSVGILNALRGTQKKDIGKNIQLKDIELEWKNALNANQLFKSAGPFIQMIFRMLGYGKM